MCIGIPMQVRMVGPGFAYCHGRGENRRISTLLVGDCAPGDWLLTFLDDARERIDALRAAEIDGVLDMLQAVFSGTSGDIVAPDFALPSSMSKADIAGLAHRSHRLKAPL
ncbi:MAG: HypC/HybG/HupF family hydrogenase formation chaperone [Glaciimonas sp.]|nr:HypC/HybG/HupF family hydrogenase formation chaperone [Glaciimonas sp.]